MAAELARVPKKLRRLIVAELKQRWPLRNEELEAVLAWQKARDAHGR